MDTTQPTQATGTIPVSNPQTNSAPNPPPRFLSADQRGVPDPVLRIQGLIDAEKNPPPQAAETPQAQPAAQPEQPSEQPAATPEPEAPAGPNKQTEGDNQPAADAQNGTEMTLDQLEALELDVTVKGEDGKDLKERKSIKDLRAGYMMQKDYQRKTAELARQREAVGEQVRNAVDGERKQYMESLQTMQALLLETAAPELKNVNWNDLAANNPLEYVRMRNRADQVAQAFSQVQARQQEASAKAKAEGEAARKQAAQKALQTLEADIPGWNDALYSQLMKHGESMGFKQEESGQWTDPRAIKLLHKAFLYDQSKAAPTQPAAEKKVAVPAPKVVKPGAQQPVNPQQQREANAMERLQRSGKLDDAAAIIRQRMGIR